MFKCSRLKGTAPSERERTTASIEQAKQGQTRHPDRQQVSGDAGNFSSLHFVRTMCLILTHTPPIHSQSPRLGPTKLQVNKLKQKAAQKKNPRREMVCCAGNLIALASVCIALFTTADGQESGVRHDPSLSHRFTELEGTNELAREQVCVTVYV